jgi:hypothetical protein
MTYQVPFHDSTAGHACDDVAAWREERLLAAGFDARLASDFAHERAVDLHRLLELVDRGCPPHLAARILAPLDYEGLCHDDARC